MRLRVLAIIAAATLFGASGAAADPTGRYVYVTPAAGFTLFDAGIKFPSQSLKDAAYVGGRAGYQWWPWLGFEAAGGMTNSHENAQGTQKIGFWHASGNVTLSGFRGLRGNPFVSAGFGTSKLSPDDKSTRIRVAGSAPAPEAGDVTAGNLEIAAGWNYWATDRIAVRVEGRDVMWMPKDKITHPLTHTMISAVAVTYAFGSKPRDSDADGVADRADRCPNTLKGATVDATGCPHDADGDGVLDGLDACNDTPKGCKIDARGCQTDADGDGVCDGLDTCPDTPKGATVDSAGCTHDSDGDGVLDGLDQCADTPKAAKVDDKGCPVDSDRDGVPDGLDKCPDTAPGVAVDSSGCPPQYLEREQEFLDTGKIRLENVQFETGKATLRPTALPVLDGVGDLLTKWPALEIEIGGHTDSKGSAKLNAKLSQARADTVRSYVLNRFPTLDRNHYVSKGYGPSRPIASNDSEAGRALNRRVEFVVLNRGVLIQEIQKRTAPAPAPAPSDTTKAAPSDTTRTPGN